MTAMLRYFKIEQTLRRTRKLQSQSPYPSIFMLKKSPVFRLDGGDYRQIHTDLCRCNWTWIWSITKKAVTMMNT